MRNIRALASHPLASRTGNILLRIGSLGAKLVFTLYMGRYLGLAEMGKYGLITAYVSLMVTILGFRFDYIVSRDIIDVPPFEIAHKMRDQMAFYGLNYLALIFFVLIAALGPLKGLHVEIIAFTLLLSVLESFATLVSVNIVSLHRPIFANILFFIRAALWTAPAMALGIFLPGFRTAETIIFWWIIGILLSLMAAFFALRHLPWREAFKAPVDWKWIKSGVGKCLLIWLGAIGGTASAYVDRFVVEHYLGLEFAGIASFYSSFVTAIQSLLQSGVFTFSYPRLISYYRKGDHIQFRQEIIRMTIQATLIAGLVSLCVGAVVPVLGTLFHRPEFTRYASTLWLMLLGIWLKSTTDSLYYVLYARRQDNLVWVGGLVILIPALGCNMLLVPVFGFAGIGYSAVLISLFLCVWRVYCLTHFRPKETGPQLSEPA
jgi:O-antigen/teichoic acid export membrane protein